MAKQIVVTMTKERETKGTWRFSEGKDRDEAMIGVLYVPKRTLKELDDPGAIKLTIDPA